MPMFLYYNLTLLAASSAEISLIELARVTTVDGGRYGNPFIHFSK